MADLKLEALPISFGAINELVLKRLLLIFEKVCLPNPVEHKYLLSSYSFKKPSRISFPSSDPLYNGDRYEKIEVDILDKFDYARRRNSITCLDLKHSGFYDKYATPLKFTYFKDIDNPNILKFLAPLCEKAQSPNAVGAHKLDIMPIYQIGNDQVKFIHLCSNIPNTDCNLDDYSSKIGRFNRLLIASEHYNLIPVFTESAVFDFFNLKINLARANSEVEINSAYERAFKSRLSSFQYLLFKISQSFIPDDLLENMSIKELIIARDNTFGELFRTRQRILKLFEQITKLEYTDDFIKHVDIFINKEVIPYVNEYNKKFTDYFFKFAKYASKVSWPLINASISVAQSLSPGNIALLSGVTAVFDNYTYNLIDHLNFRSRDKFKNTFSYFINIRETCSEARSFRESINS